MLYLYIVLEKVEFLRRGHVWMYEIIEETIDHYGTGVDKRIVWLICDKGSNEEQGPRVGHCARVKCEPIRTLKIQKASTPRYRW